MIQSERKDGGPAFACNENSSDGTHYYSHTGMSLRDYFAAQSVGALIRETGLHNVVQDEYLSALALNAYAIADALLKARDAQ